MTDIVELLRSRKMTPVEERAADEIDRLRNNNGNLLLEIADLHIKIGGLNAALEQKP